MVSYVDSSFPIESEVAKSWVAQRYSSQMTDSGERGVSCTPAKQC